MDLEFLPRELARLARIYEGEPYWPLTRSKEVVDAISRAGRAVTGIEQMRFEPGFRGPRVLGLAPLKLNRTLRWPELIEDARSQAHSELDRMTGEDTVCQITWRGPPTTSGS
jgi:hypothetical protein